MPRPGPALLALMLLVGAFLAHLSLHWTWLVEDAVISFSYARNWADGEGLVPWPGGERVEGYSNFLWVALLALGERLGLAAFDAARVLGAVFGAACLPVAWAVARRLPGLNDWTALVAPALVASSAPHTIWTGSGLETPLFGFLIALGIWRTLVEGERGGFPFAALAFLGVALTRPEGIAYAAIGGFWALFIELRSDRGTREGAKRIGLWLLTFWVPFGFYHAVRYRYFAFAFPATYYAKLDDKSAMLLSPRAPGWTYVLDFYHSDGHNRLLPLYVIGLTGVAARSPASWAGVAGVLGVWGTGALGMPFAQLRIAMALGLLLPLLAIAWSLRTRDEGWAVRGLCWSMVVFTVAFAVLAQGDWMPGFRFVAPLVVPASILFTAGLGALGQAMQRASLPGAGAAFTALAVGCVGAFATVNVRNSVAFTGVPASGCQPWKTKRRLEYYLSIKNQLALDELVVLDADMGGMTWWGPAVATDIYDKLALVDISFALNKGSSVWKRFVEEYTQEERPFDLTFWDHRFDDPVDKNAPWFVRRYFDIPVKMLPGSHLTGRIWVARRLLVGTDWPADPVELGGGLAMAGVVPAPQTAPGASLLVEVHMRRPAKGGDFTVRGFLSGPGGTRTFPVTPGYGWLPPESWSTQEIFAGRYQVPIPENATPGHYDLGLLVRDRRGFPIHPARVPDGVEVADKRGARLAPGEWRYPDAIEVVDADAFREVCDADMDRVREHAAGGDCEAAEADWDTLRLRRLDARRWVRERRAELGGAVAACWAARAESSGELEEQVAHLARARRWDRHSERLAAVGGAVADETWQRGIEARAKGEHRRAQKWFLATVRVDPTRSWARRYAEEARIARLGREPDGEDGAADEKKNNKKKNNKKNKKNKKKG